LQTLLFDLFGHLDVEIRDYFEFFKKISLKLYYFLKRMAPVVVVHGYARTRKRGQVIFKDDLLTWP
jgi:hypothetical protein